MQLKITVLVLIFIILGCSKSNYESESKMDTQLKQKLIAFESEDNSEAIKIFGKCSKAITEEMKILLEETGLQVESTIGEIFTASGTSEQIRKASSIDIVTQLSLSTRSKLLNK